MKINRFIAQISNYNTYFILGMGALLLILLVVQVILYIRFKHVTKKYQQLMKGPGGANLEEILLQHSSDMSGIKEDFSELARVQEDISLQLGHCVQNYGLIRYNAFDNMGSDLSFSLALLDRREDGVVITGIYGRDESYIYAKPIKEGQSTYSLSEEEQEAIKKAVLR